MYKEKTINRINNLKENEVMSLGRIKIKCTYQYQSCYECFFHNKKDCVNINCASESIYKSYNIYEKTI